MKDINYETFKKDYQSIVQKEPCITFEMKEISRMTRVKMDGVDRRIKSYDSVIRKLVTEKGPMTQISELYDVIRYTFLDAAHNLMISYHTVLQELYDRGYQIVKVKNTWLDGRNPYKVIKVSLRSPCGQRFEIQFHTPESYEIKEKRMHLLYKEMRLPSTSPERKRELWMAMHDLSGGLTVPFRVEDTG